MGKLEEGRGLSCIAWPDLVSLCYNYSHWVHTASTEFGLVLLDLTRQRTRTVSGFYQAAELHAHARTTQIDFLVAGGCLKANSLPQELDFCICTKIYEYMFIYIAI